ncbi:hypothetical protein GPECTOR_12g562 [Gonium pectorale]|uniref:Uncharacterized protein n=1 Tax=Gonium pectorale TaxID=33097 RepID=A0A150GPD3_GONPE|nr:hypothetical protein GPECTOR_12g562 [Gonium pectorale]|eukprot:KXZ51598.1 hypothetical protein GPECTOR_12g562 [Gonium pectorale]
MVIMDPSGASRGPGAAFNARGDPTSKPRVRNLRTCRQASDAAWVPPLATPRWLGANFSQTPAATGGRVSEVLIYVLNRGTFTNAIANVTLLLRPQGSAVVVEAPVFQSTGSQRLDCPALNRFPVNATLASAALSPAAFRNATVLGARVSIVGSAASSKRQLPHIAGVGVQLA